MSDNEAAGPSTSGGGGAGQPDDELTLPRATVQKLISEILPKEMTAAKEVKDIIVDACTEFIRLVSSEANDICEKAGKKTIGSDHCVQALKDLGFESYLKDISDVLEDHKAEVKYRESKTKKMQGSGLSQEELQAAQEKLFAASRARYEANS
ncbi:unnamed protein product [Sympodiomycopsis kandeliae]